MTRTLVAVLAAALGASFAACIDVESGESGAYGSPCGSGFRNLLLCDRESGGADPGGGGSPGGGGPGPQPATCATVCEILITCQGGAPADIAECTAECSADMPPQSLLDCISEQGCNYQSCIEQS